MLTHAWLTLLTVAATIGVNPRAWDIPHSTARIPDGTKDMKALVKDLREDLGEDLRMKDLREDLKEKGLDLRVKDLKTLNYREVKISLGYNQLDKRNSDIRYSLGIRHTKTLDTKYTHDSTDGTSKSSSREASTDNPVSKQVFPRRIHPDHEGHNQIELFTKRQIFVQRVVATSSSCASIAFCLVAMYQFLAIDPRRLVFRHQLIFFLLFYDLVKAVVLLLYPTRVLSHQTAYYNDNFCQVVGFFTATAIEGADIAILAFAVHTYLLIFQPQLTTRVKKSTRTEGGLYRYRYYVYFGSVIVPLVLAALAFIRKSGYTSLVCWCYLPQKPVWYRLVLSWVPRWCLVVSIFSIYGLIYFHVVKEFKTLGGVFTTAHRPRQADSDKPSFFSAFKYFFGRMIPKWTLPENYPRTSSSVTVTNSRVSKKPDDIESFRGDTDIGVSASNSNDLTSSPPNFSIGIIDEEDDPEIHEANLARFRERQKIIEKQMKSIFVYPFAYCFVWLFPFILYVTQINYEEENGPIFWINCMGAFMQPLNGFVDSLVFFYREQPWLHTIKRTFEREHAQLLDSARKIRRDSGSAASTKLNSRNSICSGEWVYPKWRQYLSNLRLPLFVLPDEQTSVEFQQVYLEKHADAGVRHEFSNILEGDDDFRVVLEGYNMDRRKNSPQSSDERKKEHGDEEEMDFLEFLRN